MTSDQHLVFGIVEASPVMFSYEIGKGARWYVVISSFGMLQLKPGLHVYSILQQCIIILSVLCNWRARNSFHHPLKRTSSKLLQLWLLPNQQRDRTGQPALVVLFPSPTSTKEIHAWDYKRACACTRKVSGLIPPIEISMHAQRKKHTPRIEYYSTFWSIKCYELLILNHLTD